MPGHGAGPGPAQPAGRRLVAEHDGGHPPGAPPLQRHDGSEDADHRGADRGREVGGAGVPDDDGGRAGEDPGELGEGRAAGEVHPAGGRDPEPDRLVPGPTRHHHLPALGRERPGVLGRPLGTDATRGHGCRRVHHDVGRVKPARGRRVVHREADVPGRRVAGRLDDRTHGLDLVTPAGAGVVTVRDPAVAHVEERTGERVARPDHPLDPRPLGEQGHRQRALVVRGEHDHLVVAARTQPGEELVECDGVDRVRVGPGPGHVGDDHLVDVGEQRCGGRSRPARRAGAARRRRPRSWRSAGPASSTSPSLSSRTASTRLVRRPSAMAPPEDEVDGSPQVGGHHRGGGDLLRPGHRGGHEHRAGAGGARRPRRRRRCRR